MQGQAIERARRYVEGSFDNGYSCQVGNSLELGAARQAPAEVFSAILVAELLGAHLSIGTRASLLAYLTRHLLPSGRVHFFENRELLPADVDCTALLGAALFKARAISKRRFDRLIRAIVQNQNQDGVIRVYFGDSPERAHIVDPVVAANALYALNLAAQADAAIPTERYLKQTLEEHWSSPGSRYYPCPDTLLWCAARLVTDFPERYQHWEPLVRRAILGRAIGEKLAIESSQWLFAAQLLNVEAAAKERAQLSLLKQQAQAGCWPAQALFRYGRKELYFGSSVLSTTFALCALIPRHSQRARVAPVSLPLQLPLPLQVEHNTGNRLPTSGQ